MMKYCRECGFENMDEARFCHNCGSKLDGDTAVVEKPEDIVVKAQNSNALIHKLFFKTDKYTGELRIARTKTISIIVFVAMFLFGIGVGDPSLSMIMVFIVAVIFGLIFAVPTFDAGWIVGMIIDRISH